MAKQVLTAEQLLQFQNIVEVVYNASSDQNDDAYTKLLNELYYSVGSEKFEIFARTINDANDSDFRCPK
jgi:hypothetical protein